MSEIFYSKLIQYADDSIDDSESDSTMNKSDELQGAVEGVNGPESDTTDNPIGIGTPRTPQQPPNVNPGKHNGARPKTGKTGNDSGNPPRNHEECGSRVKENAKSYSKVVTINGWKTIENKKRKRDRLSPKQIPPLKGAIVTRCKDVYVYDIDIGGVEDPDDLVEVIRLYCIDRAVSPTYIRIITSRFDQSRAGCRLTVKENDVDKVVSAGFWPDGVRAREWVCRNRDN